MDKQLILGVGPIRSGTTWLYKALNNAQPRIVPVNKKEINFWNNNQTRGFNWYLEHFRMNSVKDIFCDLSPNYITQPQKLRDTKKYFEDVKIIFNFRNPYERLVSIFGYFSMRGELREDDFLNYVSNDKYAHSHTFIKKGITEIGEFFGNENIHAIFFEDIINDPDQTLQHVSDFIGIDLKLRENYDVKEKIHKSMKPRSRILARTATAAQNILRNKLQLNFFAEYLKYNPLIKTLMFSEADKKIKANKQRDAFSSLISLVDDEITFLENYFDKELPNWKSDNYFINEKL